MTAPVAAGGRPARTAGAQRRPHPLGGGTVAVAGVTTADGSVGPSAGRAADELDESHGEIAQTHVEMLTRPGQGRERRAGVAAGHGHDESLRLLDDAPVLDHLDHLLGALLLAGAVLDDPDGAREQRLEPVEAPRGPSSSAARSR